MLEPDALRCNSRIAAALLEVLLQSSDEGAHARALKALGGDASVLRTPKSWVKESALEAAFLAANPTRLQARRIGRAVVSPESLGAFLNYGGLATLEKAYRRCDQLLAREAQDGRFAAESIETGRASIHYHPGVGWRASEDEGSSTARAGHLICGVREGMLEAVPLCYGLMPATVRETQCAHEGADHCVFEVRWSASSRRGLFTGAGLGLAAGMAIGWATGAWLPIWAGSLGALGLTVLGAAAGRSFDLARQLQAVAGARRGQLALLEQADKTIAEKMDELARVESSVENVRGHGSGHGHGSGMRLHAVAEEIAISGREGEHEERLRTARASEEIYAAIGPLQRGLSEIRVEFSDAGFDRAATPEPTGLDSSEQGAGSDGADGEGGAAPKRRSAGSVDVEFVLDTLQQCVEESRRIQAVGAELARAGREIGKLRRAVCLGEVLSRAADSLRPELATNIDLELEIEEKLPLVRCEPFQMEQVIYQLLRNATDASARGGVVLASLYAHPGGIELTIEDEGEGFSEEAVDQVFDPFGSEGPAGAEDGLGLAICSRVVEEHSGQFSIARSEGGGTRVCLVLPPDLLGGEGA